MPVKSPLLARQLKELFGGEGEVQLRQQLAAIGSPFATNLGRLLDVVDNGYVMYANLQSVQSELSGDAFSDWNLKSGNIESGRQWKTLLGYDQGDLENSIAAWQKLLHPDDLRSVQQRIAAHVQSKERCFSAECRMRARTGEWRWLVVKGLVTARDAGGEPMRMLVLHRDISEMKGGQAAMVAAKEEAEAANKARGAFLANMSHEIRTPMNGIIGMTELALDTNLDAEQKQYLKTVKSSAESLLTIVNDILDFSKIEAGKMQFEAISFSLPDLVLEATRVLAVAAHKKGLELVVNLPPELPSRVVGDPTRLRQVITNLLGNAIKFTERGNIIIELAVDQLSAGSVYIRFSVQDTGIGIPLDKQQAIFEAFSQADASTTRRFGGTGLGLAICARLVQLMDGRVWLESAAGKGSVFHFLARFGVEASAPEALPKSLRGKRAVVIDDNPVAAAHLVRLLDRLGLQASAVPDGAAALAAIERSRSVDFPYDFILADATMDAPAGFALAESWRNGGGQEKLVMMLTTENQRHDLSRLRELAVGAHLVKPIGLGDLKDALLLIPGGATGTESNPGFDLAPFEVDVAAGASDQKPLRVLLVEDNPVNQELALRLLEKRRHQVTVANDGAEALDWFDREHFDVILMDMQMPVMGGIEATNAIRAREMRRSWVVSDDFQQVYIIAMTANVMASDQDRCREAGMNDYVAKPLRPADFYAALERSQGKKSGDSPVPQPSFVAGEVPVLDLKAALCDIGDNELLANMAAMMLSEWDEHLVRIVGSQEKLDAHELRMHAHTLKSLLAMFHAEVARRLALDIEQVACATGNVDWEQSGRLITGLKSELARLKPEMERYVATKVVG